MANLININQIKVASSRRWDDKNGTKINREVKFVPIIDGTVHLPYLRAMFSNATGLAVHDSKKNSTTHFRRVNDKLYCPGYKLQLKSDQTFFCTYGNDETSSQPSATLPRNQSDPTLSATPGTVHPAKHSTTRPSRDPLVNNNISPGCVNQINVNGFEGHWKSKKKDVLKAADKGGFILFSNLEAKFDVWKAIPVEKDGTILLSSLEAKFGGATGLGYWGKGRRRIMAIMNKSCFLPPTRSKEGSDSENHHRFVKWAQARRALYTTGEKYTF